MTWLQLKIGSIMPSLSMTIVLKN